jgi:hypothetical protein
VFSASDIISILPDAVILDGDKYHSHSKLNLLAGLFPANIETIARPQKETGGYCGHGAEHPEQEESDAVSTNSADVVFDKHNAWIKGREEKNGSDARGDK